MSTLEAIALAALIVIAVPAFWCIVMFVLSTVSGWQSLAGSYEAHDAPRGTRFNMQSGSIGPVSYNNILTVYVAPDGLFLAMPGLLSFAHKPLFIPWAAIQNRQSVKFLWRDLTAFDVLSPRRLTIRLPKAVFDARTTSAQ